VGNNAKMRIYPGINRMKGNPRIILKLLAMSSSATGSNIRLQRIQMIISIGYFSNEIFILATSRLI